MSNPHQGTRTGKLIGSWVELLGKSSVADFMAEFNTHYLASDKTVSLSTIFKWKAGTSAPNSESTLALLDWIADHSK